MIASGNFVIDISRIAATASGVGTPTHEVALVEAFRQHVADLFPPGLGRSTFVVFEPELGRGRPDAIAIAISTLGLNAFRKSGLRLPSLTASQALINAATHSELGTSKRYSQQLHRTALATGWTVEYGLHVASLVADSLAIEAKVRDWRQAIRQVAAFRRYVNRAALITPREVALRIDTCTLARYKSGLIEESNGRASWAAPSPKSGIAPESALWLVELLLRGFDLGTAYKSSRDAKRSTAAEKLLIRPK